MSTLGFLGNMGIARLKKLGDDLTTALVSFDPESATEAQINQQLAHVNELARRVAKAEADAERDNKEVSHLQATYNRNEQAANILSGRLQTSDTTGKETIERQLLAIVTVMEKLSIQLDQTKEVAKQSANDVIEWRQVHQQAVASVTTARQKLEAARRDMQHAQQEEQRAKERAEFVKRDIGLKQGLDTAQVGLSAIEKAAEDARARARAAQITTNALKANSASSVDDIVAEAIASAKPSTSATECLAALKAKQKQF